jgi:hypothetical protein
LTGHKRCIAAAVATTTTGLGCWPLLPLLRPRRCCRRLLVLRVLGSMWTWHVLRMLWVGACEYLWVGACEYLWVH